jgi:homoserine O-acetyltransferase/O-succinyltransferase
MPGLKWQYSRKRLMPDQFFLLFHFNQDFIMQSLSPSIHRNINRMRGYAMRRKMVFISALLYGGLAQAYDGIVTKEVFSLPAFTTTSGETIHDLRIGYETYGRLNAAGDNVILVAHHITGTSHAAGKYTQQDPAPGYWDKLIGSGKAIDTDRYFVISSDTLVNPNVKLKSVTTTGPTSINPKTGKPYGMSFPVVSARDFIEVQKKLLDSLGVRKIQAVAGASAGAAQATEWAAAYPDMVERMISVVGPGVGNNAYTIGLMHMWGMPIKQDAKWNGGDYYGKDEPQEGVANAMKFTTFSAVSYGWGENLFKTRWASPDKNPAQSNDHLYAVEDALIKTGAARAKATDANHWLYTTRAYQLSSPEAQNIKAKALFISVSSDNIFPPFLSKQSVEKLRAHGKQAEFVEVNSEGGHIDGIVRGELFADTISAFLKK